MGQRHQIFVKIANPIKHIGGKPSQELVDLFGKGEFTILPYHNQWLFGRSALQVCLNLLKHAAQFTHEEKTSTKPWGANHTALAPNGMKYDFANPDKLTAAIAFILNYLPVKTEFNKAGMLNSWYLGKEDPTMREDFRMGDNNDGITIIDVVENKYCFMNINEPSYGIGEHSNSASDLPYLFPSSAHDYVRCYYGETPYTISRYKLDNAKENGVTPQALAKDFRNGNKKLVRQFAKFGVLTLDEVMAMFPKVQKEISEKVLVNP